MLWGYPELTKGWRIRRGGESPDLANTKAEFICNSEQSLNALISVPNFSQSGMGVFFQDLANYGVFFMPSIGALLPQGNFDRWV